MIATTGVAATNGALRAWIETTAQHAQPARVHWCDGSDEERAALERELVAAGSLIELDASLHPRSFLHRSDPSDVEEAECPSYVCTARPEDVGPTSRWISRYDAHQRVWPLFSGAMKNRTMYIVPYVLGPLGSAYSRVGVEITDSPYVVLNLRIMTCMGRTALRQLGNSRHFVRALHSLGDRSRGRRCIVHFPADSEIWSIGSGYGENALLSKACHALRIASAEARREGWLAEHMSIMGVTNPQGRTHYIAAASPSGCGKTNLAMLVPTLAGWRVDTVGDDVCWMRPGEDGRLWAINPEMGIFSLAPGTNAETNPNAMRALANDAIFTDVALRSGRRVWWEGMSRLDAQEVVEDWRGAKWTSATARFPAAHPSARFTTSLMQCPSAGGSLHGGSGVPISAIIFGSRRSKLSPLVYETKSWRQGVYAGATLVSETPAAAQKDQPGATQFDPMGMLRFCGYNMGDYFRHWLSMGRRLNRPPKVFCVNWFRTRRDGRLLWPGFGDNIRVLKWIVERLDGTAGAVETAIGLLPHQRSLDLSGADVSETALHELLAVDGAAWLGESAARLKFLQRFAERLPSDLLLEHRSLALRLQSSFH